MLGSVFVLCDGGGAPPRGTKYSQLFKGKNHFFQICSNVLNVYVLAGEIF